MLLFKPVQEREQVVAGKAPLERLGQHLATLLEPEQPSRDLREQPKAIRRQDLPLDDGEVDLNLVEPDGVDRGVDQDQRGPGDLEPPPMPSLKLLTTS